jgi:Methyltransferase domain
LRLKTGCRHIAGCRLRAHNAMVKERFGELRMMKVSLFRKGVREQHGSDRSNFSVWTPPAGIGCQRYRRTRFHTEKGDLVLGSPRDAADCLTSLLTSAARVAFDYRPVQPWITLNAFRFLRSRVSPKDRVFEWSCGMSTLWFERHCGEVYAVEDNRQWHERIRRRVTKAKVSFLSGTDYVHAIEAHPPKSFDLISIDGSSRLACFELAHEYLKPGGILLIDNTDKDFLSHGDVWRMERLLEQRSDYEVLRFPGWAHGSWAAVETTICIHLKEAGRPDAGSGARKRSLEEKVS